MVAAAVDKAVTAASRVPIKPATVGSVFTFTRASKHSGDVTLIIS